MYPPFTLSPAPRYLQSRLFFSASVKKPSRPTPAPLFSPYVSHGIGIASIVQRGYKIKLKNVEIRRPRPRTRVQAVPDLHNRQGRRRQVDIAGKSVWVQRRYRITPFPRASSSAANKLRWGGVTVGGRNRSRWRAGDTQCLDPDTKRGAQPRIGDSRFGGVRGG